ncbi:Uncharacterised protein [Mycobacteroides abscessus subsp. abscessus]|nr:Uncharacterised protein [Mycobacteroides abscessus subsp. abscessus]
MMAMISRRSSSVVSRSRDRRHWATAPSHPAREKMNVIAGSRPSSSSRVITSGRDGGRYSVGGLEVRCCGPRRRGRSKSAKRSA